MWSADPKELALLTVSELASVPNHHFQYLADLIAGQGKCGIHEKTCFLPATDDGPDILIIGFPCQPYTAVLEGRFDPGTSQNHKFYGATDETVQVIDMSKAGVVICEQVGGFNMRSKKDTQEGTPAERFVLNIKKLEKYAVRVVQLDAIIFGKVTRKR